MDTNPRAALLCCHFLRVASVSGAA